MAMIQGIYNCDSTGTDAEPRKVVKTKRIRKVKRPATPAQTATPAELADNRRGLRIPSTVNTKGEHHARIQVK